MEKVTSNVKINQLLNFFTQMFLNMNYAFKEVYLNRYNPSVFYKKEDEKFTNIDIAFQKILQNNLKKHYKNVLFIGEENVDINIDKVFEFNKNIEYSFLTSIADEKIIVDLFNQDIVKNSEFDYLEQELCIYCDPIDSTSSLIKKDYSPVTSLIGITVKGKPILGFIHYFAYEGKLPKTFLNIPNKGIYSIDYHDSYDDLQNNYSLHSNSKNKLFYDSENKKLIYANFKISLDKIDVKKSDKMDFVITATRENTKMTQVMNMYPDYKTIRVSGLGNKCVVSLLKDYFYFSPSKGLGLWDVCGPHAIIKEAGGNILYVDGEEVFYEESLTEVTLQKSVCMSTCKRKLSIFVEKLKENNIKL